LQIVQINPGGVYYLEFFVCWNLLRLNASHTYGRNEYIQRKMHYGGLQMPNIQLAGRNGMPEGGIKPILCDAPKEMGRKYRRAPDHDVS